VERGCRKEGDRRLRAGDDHTRRPEFVPPAERIATFDQDGTLWVEHPIYTQVMYVLETRAGAREGQARTGQGRPVLDRARIAEGRPCGDGKADEADLFKLLAATSTGMPVETFQAEAKKWIAEAKDPRWKKPYTELTYLPMQEVLKYLRANGYKTYIVTGGGQDFVRVYSEATYGIPPEQVVGSAGGTKYGYDRKWQAVPDEGAEAPAERQQRGQARRHST
jgi:phosphoglycolate phosphatase-like HAD superfamily hydrolase